MWKDKKILSVWPVKDIFLLTENVDSSLGVFFFSTSRKRFLLSSFYHVKTSSQLISCRELAAFLLALLDTPWLGWVRVVGL